MKVKWLPSSRNSSQFIKFDTDKLLNDPDLAERYSVNISNRFSALTLSEEDVESDWTAICSAIRDSAEEVVGRKKPVWKPWLSDEAFQLVQKKSEARIHGNRKECNRLKRQFQKKAKEDKEIYYNRIADEAEAGMVRNDLKAAYRAIKFLGGSTDTCHNGVTINDLTGNPCKSDEDTLRRWMEHYEGALNHPPARPSSELDSLAADALPDADVADDAPNYMEVRSAIRKLKNGRAAGGDNIPPELLKCAIDPVAGTLHGLFCTVWKRRARCPWNGKKVL